MRRFTSIILLVAVAALGSGLLRYVHELDHAAHDATQVPHDESNCLTHAQLKAPMLAGGIVPLLVCIGLFVAFLTMLPTPQVASRRPSLPLDSRGPPASLSF